MFPLMSAWTRCWINSRVAGDLRHHNARATVMNVREMGAQKGPHRSLGRVPLAQVNYWRKLAPSQEISWITIIQLLFDWVFTRCGLVLIYSEVQNHCMMTSSNGNIFRVAGPLCGEFTGHRWIPHRKASDAELWYFLGSAPEYMLEQTIVRLVIWDAIALIMTSS